MLVHLHYSPSRALRNRVIVETGDPLPVNPFVSVELADLTTDQRRVIVEVGIGSDAAVKLPAPATLVESLASGPGLSHRADLARTFDAIPSVDEWIAAAREDLAAEAEAQRQLADAIAAWKIVQAERNAAEQTRRAALEACRAEIDALEAAADLDGLQAYRGHHDRGLYERGALVQSREFDLAATARDRAIANLEKARRAEEKAAWIADHGSDYLRRAHSAGYDCQRLYVTERAANDAPGFVVDFADQARWKSRACPSVAALDLLDRATGYNVGQCEIVWLMAGPADATDTWDEPQEREAVVIRGYLGKYDLVAEL